MGHDKHHDDKHKGSDHHHAGDDHHQHDDDHHHHHHEEPKFLPYKGQKLPPKVLAVPAMGSDDYYSNQPVYDEKKIAREPRSNTDRLLNLLSFTVQDDESAGLSINSAGTTTSNATLMERIFHVMAYPMPRTYTSPYLRPNPCPEVHWWNSWRWPKFRWVNPKVEPPLEGAYNDYYHFLAFRNWFENERSVYYHTVQIHHEILLRCIAKEGKYNGWKNCKHLLNKEFAMSRESEHNQMLMYMAVTGNAAIRETPYPDDFVEQKRKIYDNWLFRTRMRKPGDVM